MLSKAWSSAKAFAGRALGRTQTSGYGGDGGYFAAHMDVDDDEHAQQLMLGRSNARL